MAPTQNQQSSARGPLMTLDQNRSSAARMKDGSYLKVGLLWETDIMAVATYSAGPASVRESSPVPVLSPGTVSTWCETAVTPRMVPPVFFTGRSGRTGSHRAFDPIAGPSRMLDDLTAY
jgi:hypothetical protein